MKGDFSRLSFDRTRHDRGVYQQVGRVQLDADFNERLEIWLHREETLAADLLGPAGTSETGNGFQLFLQAGEVRIRAGRFYIDGILCELREEQEGEGIALADQPDLPSFEFPTADGHYLAYLDVWVRHLSATEEPALAEPAATGTDSTTRDKVICQIKLQPILDHEASCALFGPGWSPVGSPPPPPGRLAARAVGTPLNNQLYRIEVHQGGTHDVATFKWSRDNAALVATVANGGISATQITLQDQPGGNPTSFFSSGQWVEVTDDQRALDGAPGVLVRLSAVEHLVLRVDWPEGTAPLLGDGAVVRPWDSVGALPVALATGAFLSLEEGLEICFAGEETERFTSGDYWLIPLRTAAGVLWPAGDEGESTAEALPREGEARFVDPLGIRHRYAPLGVLHRDNGIWAVTEDCRRQFLSLTEIDVPEKVDRPGDTMRGSLTIESDLWVTGQAHLGSTQPISEDGVRLRLASGALQPAAGVSDQAGIQFTPLAASQAFIQSANSGGLLLGISGTGDSLRFFQNGADRLVVQEGNVGIGELNPQARLHVNGEVRSTGLLVEGGLTIADGSEQEGFVLTSDAEGQGQWLEFAQQQEAVSIIFFDEPLLVGENESPLTNQPFSSDSIPAGALAVILQAEGTVENDSSGLENRITVRKVADSEALLLLRGTAGGDDRKFSWTVQGIYPVDDNGDFLYTVENLDGQGQPSGVQTFSGGWKILVLGYFEEL